MKMSEKKAKIIIIGGFILIAIVVIIIAGLMTKASTNGNTTTETIKETADVEGKVFNQNNREDLLSAIADPKISDERGGTVAGMSSGFEVDDNGEYYRVYDPSNGSGGILYMALSDFDAEQPIDVFIGSHGIRERAEFLFGGDAYKTVLYDIGDSAYDAQIEGKACLVEESAVTLRDIGAVNMTYIYTVVEHKPIVVAYAVKPDANDGDKSVFKSCAYELLKTVQNVKYTGEGQTTQAGQETALYTTDFGKHQMMYPAGWLETKKSESKIYKPVVMLGDCFQRSSILYTKTTITEAEAAEPEWIEASSIIQYKLGDLIGDACSQNPNMTNNRTFKTLFVDKSETKMVNGHSMIVVSGTGTIGVKDTLKLTSIPDMDYGFNAYLSVEGTDFYCYIFIYQAGYNDFEMQSLGTRIMDVYN